MKYIICKPSNKDYGVDVYTPTTKPEWATVLGDAVATSPEQAVARWLNLSGERVKYTDAEQQGYMRWFVDYELFGS